MTNLGPLQPVMKGLLSTVYSTGRCTTIKFCVSRRSVTDEAETSDLLHRKSEKIDVGSLVKRRLSSRSPYYLNETAH